MTSLKRANVEERLVLVERLGGVADGPTIEAGLAAVRTSMAVPSDGHARGLIENGGRFEILHFSLADGGAHAHDRSARARA